MKFRIILLFLLLTILGGSLRFWKLGTIPSGFYSDESLYGYEAYSLFKTGKDQFGNRLPLSIAGFGDYRPAFYIYTNIPFIALLGLTEFAVRLPSAVYSVINIFLLYLLATTIFANRKKALICTFLFSVSGWGLQFARMAHENNLATLLISGGILSLISVNKNVKYFPLAIFLFGLSFFTYHNARIFVPLIVILLFTYINIRTFFKKENTPVLLLSIVLCLVFSLLIIRTFLDQTSWSRIANISLWNNPGTVAEVIEGMRFDNKLGRIYHNKLIILVKDFGKSFLSHFHPGFLLFEGDPNEIYQTPGNGILLWFEPLIIIAGLYGLFHSQNKYRYLLLFWLLLGLVPDSLTKVAPSSARIHLSLPAVSLIGGFGLAEINKSLQKMKYLSKSIIFFLVLIFIYNYSYYLHYYYRHLSVIYAKQWHYGIRQVVAKVREIEGKYQTIWVSPSVWGWENFLFYLRYPPEVFQKEAVVSARNEYGFWWVFQFGKFIMKPINGSLAKGTLYIGEPDEFINKVPLYEVKYPDEKIAFWLVEG